MGHPDPEKLLHLTSLLLVDEQNNKLDRVIDWRSENTVQVLELWSELDSSSRASSSYSGVT